MGKILTIVIPTYNMEKYLRKCLDSLIIDDKELFEKLEVLIVNDGSKDSSSAIAHEYQENYPNVFRVIDKENGNYGSCVNRGLKEATGKYIKILDADDYFDNIVFTSFLTYLYECKTDLIINDYRVVNEEGKKIADYSFNLPMVDDFSLSELSDNVIQWLWHHGITYRKDIFKGLDYRQTEGISYTDDEWIYKPMVNVKSISYFSHILYLYLRGREGQTFDPNVLNKTFYQKCIVAQSLIDFYKMWYAKCDKGIQRYLTLKLVCRLHPIYFFYLIEHSNNTNSEILKAIDLKIADNALPVYNALATIRNRLGFSIIKMWRNSNYHSNTILLMIMRLISKTKIILCKEQTIPIMPSTKKK